MDGKDFMFVVKRSIVIVKVLAEGYPLKATCLCLHNFMVFPCLAKNPADSC